MSEYLFVVRIMKTEERRLYARDKEISKLRRKQKYEEVNKM